MDELRDLEIALLNPDVRRSREEMSGYLADGFVEFASTGQAFDKPAILDALARETGPREFLLSDMTVRQLSPQSALVTYRAVAEGRLSLRSSVWATIDGRWRMVFHQGTPVPRAGDAS